MYVYMNNEYAFVIHITRTLKIICRVMKAAELLSKKLINYNTRQQNITYEYNYL